MAEKIVSPGVFTRENDLSFLPQGISQIGAAIVGPTEKGPAFVPTLVTSQAEYEQIFGAPKDYYTGYTVQNYLRDAGSVTVVINLTGSSKIDLPKTIKHLFSTPTNPVVSNPIS